jgi:hypothetical protein
MPHESQPQQPTDATPRRARAQRACPRCGRALGPLAPSASAAARLDEWGAAPAAAPADHALYSGCCGLVVGAP